MKVDIQQLSEIIEYGRELINDYPLEVVREKLMEKYSISFGEASFIVAIYAAEKIKLNNIL